jgi:mRNA interferase MazF
MRRGTVVRVDLPQPKGQPGHEQFGHRPAVIIQDDTRGANLSTVVLIPLTSNLASASFTGSIIVDPDSHNGLTLKSVILTHQVRSIDRKRIVATIGSLSDETIEIIEKELRSLLAL